MSAFGNSFSQDDGSRRARVSAARCTQCGYDLRGLVRTGSCPECGTPIWRSLSDSLLRFCDPTWLGQLTLGSRLVLLGVVGHVLIVIVSMLAAFMLFNRIGWNLQLIGAVRLDASAELVLELLTGIADLTALFGIWLQTTADPGRRTGPGARRPTDDWLSARVVARLVLMLVALRVVAQAVFSVAPPDGTQFALRTFAATVAYIQIVGVLAYLHHMSGMLARVPERGLVRLARWLFFGNAAFWLLSTLGLFALYAAIHNGVVPAFGTLFTGTLPTVSAAAGSGGVGFAYVAAGTACAIGAAQIVLVLAFLYWQYRMQAVFAEAALAARTDVADVR